eukprot:gene12393-16623_t
MSAAQEIKSLTRPASTAGLLSLDLSVLNRDGLFFIDVKTEDGSKICDGLVSKDVNNMSCPYEKTLLKHGDNSFILTISSADKSVEYIKTVQHYFHDGNLEEEKAVVLFIPPRGLLLFGLLFLGGGAVYSRYQKPVAILPIPSPKGIPPPLFKPSTKSYKRFSPQVLRGAGFIAAAYMFGYRGSVAPPIQQQPVILYPPIIIPPVTKPKPFIIPTIPPGTEIVPPKYWRTALVFLIKGAMLAARLINAGKFQQHAGAIDYYNHFVYR